MAMKNDVKFEEELTCHFKIDVKNLMNFDRNTQKSLNILLQWAAFDKSIESLSLESTEELCLMVLKIAAKTEGKLTCAFKINMKNLANVYHSSRKSQNQDFNGILLSKVENV